MPGRSFNSNAYRYGGAGGQEKDDEVAGVGNSYTAQFWQFDPRLGRRWNVDPVTQPWQTNYQAFNNNPLVFTDPLGLFGTRREARQYKREHGLKGWVQKGRDGIFSINNRRERVSYFKDDRVRDNAFIKHDGGAFMAGMTEGTSKLTRFFDNWRLFSDGLKGSEYSGKRRLANLAERFIINNLWNSEVRAMLDLFSEIAGFTRSDDGENNTVYERRWKKRQPKQEVPTSEEVKPDSVRISYNKHKSDGKYGMEESPWIPINDTAKQKYKNGTIYILEKK